MLPHWTNVDAVPTEAKQRPGKPADLPTLQLLRNGIAFKELSLDLPRVLVGRSEDNDICIPSRYVSRNHILLIRHDDSMILVDLGSTNGTYVNSKRVGTHLLANGDVITIDRKSMFVRYSIKYSDPSTSTHAAFDEIESVDKVIQKALADIGSPFAKSDTDVIPMLSENVPTVMGFVDDR